MYPLSKKWRSHFFEKKPLGVRVRATPRGFLPYLKGMSTKTSTNLGRFYPSAEKAGIKPGKLGTVPKRENPPRTFSGKKPMEILKRPYCNNSDAMLRLCYT